MERSDPDKGAGTVYLVDDEEPLLRTLSKAFNALGFRVEGFGSAEQFLAHLPPEPQGCLVLDLRMPQMGGLALQAELGARGVFLPIVFLTGHGSVEESVRALKAGAVDFLQKPVGLGRLAEAVELALRLSSREAEARRERAEIARRVASLTPRELEVYALVVAGLRNREIAERLHIAEKTVKVHRSRVMMKLQATSLAHLVLLSQKLRRPSELGGPVPEPPRQDPSATASRPSRAGGLSTGTKS